ncbi:hypothetical protein AB4Z42_13380 [Mycobacterium sp. 2YAF39]|uniref:PPE domain-containing protein n=1 Tax=Mycobacterium sp. 2YAF39 TaxID=3233033 RepID=UPI003F957473
MAGDVQRVEPGALRTQAAEMKGQNWHNPAEDAVTPPDALPSTNDAIANLNDNAQSLKAFEQWAAVENLRIAEMLDIAAAAYQKVDDQYGKAIENPERAAAVEAITIPDPPTQPPEIPGPAGAPRLLGAGGYSNVNQTQTELSAPDTGTSLKTAMLQWGVASKRVENNRPKPPPGSWEGEAADAAYARMTTFGSWLTQLSDAWYDLAEAASKIIAAHDKAKSAHDPIANEYIELEARMMQLAGLTGPHGGVRVQMEMEKIRQRMEELQAQSDEVRQDYASGATFSPVRPADPPSDGSHGSTTTSGGGGGAAPTGDPAAMAQKMAQSLGTPQSDTAAGQQDGGAGGGSPSGGESPSGGGASGGGEGAAPGGEPSTGTPKLPTDPSLRPAASSGSGGGGGGARGGGSDTPLSPAVTAETVAPGPPMPVATGHAAATATPGVAGGGMGGMAPMHGGQGGMQGKEKRRDPRTAPDEDLYTEDRAWTEGVVGNRRRKEVQDFRDGSEGPDGTGGRETP